MNIQKSLLLFALVFFQTPLVASKKSKKYFICVQLMRGEKQPPEREITVLKASKAENQTALHKAQIKPVKFDAK